MTQLPHAGEYWKFVPGFSKTPEDQLELAASRLNAGETAVIVGAGLGRDVCCMMEKMQKNNAKFKLYVIDPWGEEIEDIHGESHTGSTPWGEPLHSWYYRMRGPGCFLDAFQFYVSNSPASKHLYDYVQNTSSCGNEFEPESISFAYLSFSKTPKYLEKDILSWWPKIKRGGSMVIQDFGLKSIVRDAIKDHVAVDLDRTTSIIFKGSSHE